MTIAMECRKLKRTGFLPAVLGVGLLSAMVPVVNTAVRPQLFQGRGESPLQILLEANWQMITMMNVFLIILAACVMYHTEFADNAAQKMDSLPLWPGCIFIQKTVILAASAVLVILLEAAGLVLCVYHWFQMPEGFWTELLKTAGSALLLLLPVTVLMLFVASVGRNMWVSLGIGIIGLFVAIVVPQDMLAGSVLEMFPFALPFQMLSGEEYAFRFLYAAAAETFAFLAAEAFYLKIRRYLA